MRLIEHTGPVATQRRQSVEGSLDPIALSLPAGADLLHTLSSVLDAHGAQSAVAMLHGGSFSPFAYVMPALSRTPEHAVYFSDRHVPQVPVHLETATVTVGRREGQPWLHCHGTWHDANGERQGGHMLPNEAVISQPIAASIWLLRGVNFVVLPNEETRFTLFQPMATTALPGAARAIALQVSPNEDLCTALEAECAARGITQARIRGGVGSLVGAVFDDGRTVEPFVTEVLVREGTVSTDSDGQLRADVDVTMVDYTGGLTEGRLQRGANAVLVTFELVIEPIAMR